jgi:hypothetical protein
MNFVQFTSFFPLCDEATWARASNHDTDPEACTNLIGLICNKEYAYELVPSDVKILFESSVSWATNVSSSTWYCFNL